MEVIGIVAGIFVGLIIGNYCVGELVKIGMEIFIQPIKRLSKQDAIYSKRMKTGFNFPYVFSSISLYFSINFR